MSRGLPGALRSALLQVTAAGVLCGLAMVLEQAAVTERERLSTQVAAARGRLITEADTREARRVDLPRYLELRRRGLITPDARLGVLEALQRDARLLRLRNVEYELSPATVAGGVATSRMKLRVGVVHEGELLRLLDRLRADAPAVLRARRCLLERTGDGTALRPDSDNLLAECDLDWLTIPPQP